MTDHAPLRIALVGTGYWARHTHAAGLQGHPDVEFAGVWGRSGADAVANEFGVEAYRDLDQLIGDVDAVAFAVPPDVQAEIALQAAARGRHLLLEKPVALDEQRAAELAAAVEANGVRSAVFLTLLYEPGLAAWLKENRSESLGDDQTWISARIRMFSSIFSPGSPYAGSDWRRTAGALWDLGPHALSVAVRALGDVAAVQAMSGVGDATEIVLRHDSGATSTISVSLTAPEAACGSDWTFYGPRGAVSAPVPADIGPAAYRACVDDLVSAVRTGSAATCDAAFGADLVRVLSAAEAAIELAHHRSA